MAGLSASSPASLSLSPNFPEGSVSSVGVEGLPPGCAIRRRARLRSAAPRV